MPTSVRPAVQRDAPTLAAIQLACWAQIYQPGLPELAEALDAAAVAASWEQAIALTGGQSPYRLWVALDQQDAVAGFAALGPCMDPDAAQSPQPEASPLALELVALYVAPPAQRQGHGSRLLAAVAAHGRQVTNQGRLNAWVFAGDYIRQRFLKAVGFGPDGSTRSWRTEAGDLVDEARWATVLG